MQTLTMFLLNGKKEYIRIKSCKPIQDIIQVDNYNSLEGKIESQEINGIDLMICELENPVDKTFIKIDIAEGPPEGDLFCIFLDKDENDNFKSYCIPAGKIVQYHEMEDQVLPRLKKMFFMEGFMVPGISGSALIAEKIGNTLTVYGVFCKKINIQDKNGDNKPIFAFTPLSKYKMDIKNIIDSK